MAKSGKLGQQAVAGFPSFRSHFSQHSARTARGLVLWFPCSELGLVQALALGDRIAPGALSSTLNSLNGFHPQGTKPPAQFRATGYAGREKLLSSLPGLKPAPAQTPTQQGATGLESTCQRQRYRLLHGHAGHPLGTSGTRPSLQSSRPLTCRPVLPWRHGSLPHQTVQKISSERYYAT